MHDEMSQLFCNELSCTHLSALHNYTICIYKYILYVYHFTGAVSTSEPDIRNGPSVRVDYPC